LKYFSPNELEQTLLALETFGGAANGQESLLPLKKMLQKELKSNGQKSFTNLWDDELRYRYAATTFIPLAPGTELQEGRVRVLRQLGFGGLSAIYLVQRNKMELAILKESVLPADVDDELRRKAEEQFQREAMILAKLDHPHISKVLDYFVERGHYLLLDYVTGHDLRQLVQEGGCLSEEQVRVYAREIANILEYLHGREPAIIHRDLTPENMILDENGNITVIDFGAANEFLHTATGTLVGKHCYMAPEQLRGKANKQSDLYSLGCCLYFLLTGKDPVPLSASRPSQQRSDISDELDQLICDLTQTSLDARIKSAAALKERLEDLQLGQGTVVCSKTLMME
jgi:serine/threonine-protein kinase